MPGAAVRNLCAVDTLEVQVLVDNVTDSLSTVPGGVTNEVAVLMKNGSLPMAAGEYRCCAHHGLSLIITAHVGGDRQTLVFDAGPEAYAMTRNGALLRVPFGDAGAVVLSHGHWDHAGGLVEAVRLVAAANGGRRVECHVNPGMFVPRGTLRHGGEPLPQKPVPSPQELAAAGATVVNAPESRLLLDNCFYLSGEIPRVTPYERGLPGHLKRAADGSAWEPDPWLMDERYVAAHVKGKGAVVFTACSHAGVINVLKDARAVFGDVPLHAVMGGFHLSGQQIEEIIPDTINDMKGFGLKRIIPAHCTGWRAVGALVQAFGEERIVPSAVGRQFVF
ncbi:MAG TPA: MBL fold metallo-hydrolase [Burkholderiales bacterium]|nr:MBL fold metallo-hydrolase [Burkholderiales bacterium]